MEVANCDIQSSWEGRGADVGTAQMWEMWGPRSGKIWGQDTELLIMNKAGDGGDGKKKKKRKRKKKKERGREKQMKGMFKSIVIVVVGVLVIGGLINGRWPYLGGLAFAEIPHLISYQGKLGDKDGKPLTGAYDITFRIYDAETGGNLKWSEIHSGMVVKKGYFSLMLGSLTALDIPFDQPYWLTIQVGDDPEMTPRQRIGSVGYAYRAESCNAEDMIMRGFEFTYKGTGDLYVEPGILFNGDTRVKKTSRSTLTLVNDSDWIDGSKPASLANLWVYVYCDSEGNLKLQETSPNKADTEGNTDGKKLYYATAAIYYRWIGQVRTNALGQIVKFYQLGDWVFYDVKKSVLTNGTAGSYTDVDCSAYVPATSRLIEFDAYSYNSWGAGTNATSIQLRTNGGTGPARKIEYGEGHFQQGRITVSVKVVSDGNQVVEYIAAATASLWVTGYYNPRN